uniref:TraB/GumN family protein n=1 Tax=Altererythrobacter segetis TaxID=1104773 RepID=UPI00140B9455|nr:TraB/GumN family protein [Altererythrobacter segetis]
MRALAALALALALAGCGEPARDWPAPSPALWEVTGPGGAHGWLFGTIHSLPEGAHWRTKAVDQALADSGVLVVEIANLGDAAAAKEAFDRLATTPGLPPLSQRVPAKERPALAAFLGRAGLADDAFPHTETWAAAIVLANRARGRDPGTGVDRALIAGAKRVEGLETFEQQYRAFDALPPAEQADLLLALAREADDTSDARQVEAWLTGDLAGLESDSSAGVLADPQLREALQVARNRRWAERIARLLAGREQPFVAVGEAHMFGEQNLPELLEARGYTVRRVQ